MSHHYDVCDECGRAYCRCPVPETERPIDRPSMVTALLKLDARVIELEARFRHPHVSNGVDDACRECRFDLRDPIHEQVRP